MDLAIRFQISQLTVSRILITGSFFSMSDSNKSPYCIIDTTEIFIQPPSNPLAQQLTFSSYKNHNTLKALVCITPSGAMSFNCVTTIWRMIENCSCSQVT